LDKIRLGRSEIHATATAFGCLPLQRRPMDEVVPMLRKAVQSGINYFDTARMYSDSEEKLGEAFEGMRDKIYIATKGHHFTYDGIMEDIAVSLKNLRTDYVDLLQVHNPPFCPRPDGADGVYKALLELKDAGKIRHIGITNHRLPIAKEAVESGLYETLQFPFAYISSKQDFELVELCKKLDVGFIAMKPFGGGLLSNAGASYTFYKQNPYALPIYGFQFMEQLLEVLSFEDCPPDEAMAMAVIEKDRKELTGNFCRNCGYCQPCPIGIRVDLVTRMPYNLKRMPVETLLTPEWKALIEDTENCIHCGQCSSRCPYELDPPSRFEEVRRDFLTQYEAFHKK